MINIILWAAFRYITAKRTITMLTFLANKLNCMNGSDYHCNCVILLLQLDTAASPSPFIILPLFLYIVEGTISPYTFISVFTEYFRSLHSDSAHKGSQLVQYSTAQIPIMKTPPNNVVMRHCYLIATLLKLLSV